MVLTYYASTIGTILAIPMVCHMQIPVFYLLRANSPSPPRHASTPTLWPHLYEYEYECPVLPPPSSMELVLMGSDSTLFSLPLLNLHLPSKCITVPLLTSFRIQLMIFNSSLGYLLPSSYNVTVTVKFNFFLAKTLRIYFRIQDLAYLWIAVGIKILNPNSTSNPYCTSQNPFDFRKPTT